MTSHAAPFSTRLARLGWAGLAAVALLGSACAQAQTASPAEPPCALMVKGIDGYVFVRMRNFDPSNKAVPLYPANPADSIDAVICERKSLVPEPTDYRVISEMRMPLAIRSGGVTVWLGAENGRLSVQVPAGAVNAADQQAIKARVDELQKAMEALKPAAQPAPAAPAQPGKAASSGRAGAN